MGQSPVLPSRRGTQPPSLRGLCGVGGPRGPRPPPPAPRSPLPLPWGRGGCVAALSPPAAAVSPYGFDGTGPGWHRLVGTGRGAHARGGWGGGVGRSRRGAARGGGGVNGVENEPGAGHVTGCGAGVGGGRARSAPTPRCGVRDPRVFHPEVGGGVPGWRRGDEGESGARPVCPPHPVAPTVGPRVFCVGVGVQRCERTKGFGDRTLGLGTWAELTSTRVSIPPDWLCVGMGVRHPAVPLVFCVGAAVRRWDPTEGFWDPNAVWGHVRGSPHACPSPSP